jgi:LysR family transcriptional regulator, nitrogen assimilation regulatory protein
LHYFVKIVEAGSLSRAATLVYVAQPALSSQMAELEQELGVPLLHRNARGVTPTTAGETLYKEACLLLRHFDRIPEIVRSTGMDAAGSVSLGMSSTLTFSIAGPFMKACKESLPNVSLSFFSEDSVSLKARIAQHTLDLALVFEAKPSPGVSRTELFRQRLFLLHTDESHRNTESLSLPQVAQFPLILPAPPNGVRRLLDEEFAAAKLTPTVVAEIRDFASDIAAVRSGIGATILPIGDLSAVVGADSVIATQISAELRLTASVVCANDAPLTRAAEAVRVLMGPFITRYMQETQPPGMEPLSP